MTADDGFRSYQLGQAIRRERRVRAGVYPPLTPDEERQAAEGPKPGVELDAVKTADARRRD